MRKRLLLMAVLLFPLLLSVGARQALAGADTTTIEEASAQEVVDGMANKLARGVANVGTGWLEIPKQIYLTYGEEGAAKAATIGPLKGIGMAVVRTVSGAGEALTFFVAYPGFFDPFFEPAYVWQKE